MRDYQEIIVKFVKIVERHPEVYDSSLDTYRTAHTDMAWQQIAEAVKAELGEDCTVEEIKTKWKGIRSSYNRFKNSLLRHNPETGPKKKYYLYDALRFLEPFMTHKGGFFRVKERAFEDCGNCTYSDDDKTREDMDSELESWEIKIKSEVPDTSNNILTANDVLTIEGQTYTMEASPLDNINERKRNCNDTIPMMCSTVTDENDSEDLQFFKSILPDIKEFSPKDKRQLKMGILKLIDDIEDNRKRTKSHPEVSSSKIKRVI